MKQIISSFCIPRHLKWLFHSFKIQTGRRVDLGPGRLGSKSCPGLNKNPLGSWSGNTRSTRVNSTRPGYHPCFVLYNFFRIEVAMLFVATLHLPYNSPRWYIFVRKLVLSRRWISLPRKEPCVMSLLDYCKRNGRSITRESRTSFSNGFQLLF